MRSRLLIALLLAFLATACATITAPPTPESARIRVYVHAPVDTALGLVETAFTHEGLTIASAAGGVVVSVPVDIATSVPVTYRATVLSDSGGARVILSGTVRNIQGAAMGAYMTGVTLDPGDQPLHSAMTGKLGDAWQRLEQIARQLGPQS